MLKQNSNELIKHKWDREAAAAGFLPMGKGHCYQSNGVTLKFVESWIQLESHPKSNTIDPLTDRMGKPALWKCVTTQAGQIIRLFEFPLSIVSETEPGGDDGFENALPSFPAMLAWALETRNGGRLDGWRCPSARQVHALVSDKDLTVKCGVHARQGELICEPGRLALKVPIVFSLPDELSESRGYWLRRLLIAAQDQWKMVCVGFNDGHSGSVQAEVDLTGAPQTILADLVKIALAALHAAVAWVLPSAMFLVDGTNDWPALKVQTGVEQIQEITNKRR